MNRAGDLFLLLLNLSQMRNRGRIMSLYLESLGALFPSRTFRQVGRAPGGASPGFPVATRKSDYGRIVTEGEESWSEEDQDLLHNSTQMLAVVLERLDFEDKLDREGSSARQVADERLLALQATVEQLRKSQNAAVNLVEDLTRENDERRQAEAALRRSEERHRSTLQTAMDGFWLADPEGRLLEVNDTYSRMSGYSEQELLTRRISDLEDVEAHEETAAHLQKAVAQGSDRFVSRHRRKDGSVFSVEVSVQYRPSEGGRFVVFLRDLTEELRNVEEHARLEDQLRHSQRVEAIGRLAGGVAHDFNNLTAIVLGYAEILLGRLGTQDPSRKYVEQIASAGRRSATLTRQLLAFGRRQTLLPEVLDVNALIRNLALLLRPLIREDVELEFKLAAELGCVTADSGQLEQVVTNLVANARDAMPGGGRLTVETADVEVGEGFALDHEIVVPGRYVRLAVTDTGCGMDKEALARLFEPFYSTKERGKGTGLGLATAYGIVKQSGGFIGASSKAGAGTTFEVYLPRTEARPMAKGAEAGGEAPRGNGELILLVEDEAPLRELCELTLTQLGYRVSAAASGPEALRLVREQGIRPELVLTDVIMPEMSGAALAERLRSDRRHLAVLYMSGYPDDALSPHGVLALGTPFIQKPFTARALAAKVRETLPGALASASASTSARAGRRVLIVDDDEQFRELVQHFCNRSGHHCTGADSAATALAALAEASFDVLLVDLNIPGTSGEQVLSEIRAAGHATPAIILTGDVASAELDALRKLGAAGALEKSSDAGPLLQAIAAA